MISSVDAYGGKQYKSEVFIIKLIKEPWELLLLSAKEVASKLLNGSYVGMILMYFCFLIT